MARPLRFDPIEEARRQWDEHGWSDSSAGMAAITSVMRVQQIFLARADEVLQRFELTFARYEVLMLLTFSARGMLPLNKIGERLQVHGSSVTNAIDRLEGQGFVRRTPNPRDGRGTLAELTAAGRRTALRATGALNDEVFADIGVDDRDLRALFRVLQRIRSAAGDFS